MVFGPYVLRQRLGVGGMASVWTAVDGDGRELVVKRMLPSLAADDELAAMFDREATLSARLRHPNIVRVLGHGSYEGERYLAMERLRGRDAATVMMELVRRGPPPPGLGALVALGLSRALAYVHALAGDDGAPLGLVHRDVSLSNVMLGFDGSVKLLDFGVAKELARERSQKTQVGVLKGKWSYLAPEQVEGGASDHRADLFALGIVTWEMLTGRRLFKGATGLETLEKVRAAEVAAPSTVNPAVPAALDAIVLQALAREPEARWPSAAAMGDALDGVVAALGFGARELGRAMASLFGDDEDTAPVVRLPLEPTWEPGELLPPDETLREPTVLPSTLDSSRRRSRADWRLVLAAALAAAAGAFTGWQISLLQAAR
jgi:serine/threonine protein kinase